MISSKLPDAERYVKLHPLMKKPKSQNWNIKPISKPQANLLLKEGYNIGFLLGHGYVCIDCDSLELQQALDGLISKETYTQLSARKQLKQFLFKIDFPFESISLSFQGREVGDVLADTKTGAGKQFVLAPSKYKITQDDVKKCPDICKKAGEIRNYVVINDILPVELTKEELMSVILQFDSGITKKATQEQTNSSQDSEIDKLSITSVLSTAGMEKDSRGQYFGSNPFHGSSGGHNFYINPVKNLAYCFHTGCDCAISPARAIALQAGIIKNCSDALKGEDFIKTLEIAKAKGYIKTDELAVSSQDVNKELEVMTVLDYVKFKPDKNFIIKNVFYPNENVMVYGQSRHFKSLIEMYKAICIASGKPFLGFQTKKQPVLYCSAENNIQTDKNRILRIMKGLGLRKKDILLFVLPRNKCEDILTNSFRKKITNFIIQKKIKVVVLDTINPLTPELDDNSGRDVTKLFNNFLKPLNDNWGCSVIFLHHTGKPSKSNKRPDYLGSVKFLANVDAAYNVLRIYDTNEVLIANTKNRSGEIETLRVMIDFLEERIVFNLLAGMPEKKKRTKHEELKEAVLNLISKGEISRKQIIKKLSLEKSAWPELGRVLNCLRTEKRIKNLSKGNYQAIKVEAQNAN